MKLFLSSLAINDQQAARTTKQACRQRCSLVGRRQYVLFTLAPDTGVDKLLAELAKQGVVYGGGSAGAIIAGTTLKHFETADDPSEAPEAILDGLAFTDSVVVPHMDNAKFAVIIHGINDKLKADGYKTVPLGDNQALVINGSEQKVV